MSPREKVLFMKPVLAPLLPADMASAKVYPERLYGNAKCLCPEGRLCTDSVSRIVSCTGGIHSVSILFAVSVWILVWIGGLVKEAVFDLVLSCNSLFSGIMERLPVMLLAGMPVRIQQVRMLYVFLSVKNKK